MDPTNMDIDEQQQGYKWEVAYAEGLNLRDVLTEDEGGSIEKAVKRLVAEAKRQRRLVDRPSKVRLGIMRYIYIVIDCSLAMLDRALYPNRLAVTINILNKFLDKFFEQNPISQIGIILAKDKRAERLLPLTSNPSLIKESLSEINGTHCVGEFSLYNSLDRAFKGLQDLPSHTSREILLIMASLSTIDAELKRKGIRCSVIGLSAELYVCRKLCATTSGRYDVILDESHFEIILNDQINPPVVKKGMATNVVKMGFPKRSKIELPSFCVCHQADPIAPRDPESTDRAYFCPQCDARYCSVPIECRICGLTLLTAPQLARAHQNLTPLLAFAEVNLPQGDCYACRKKLEEKAYSCKKCNSLFCLDCDLILHESLQICPACH
uniref:General transcription factor IIH subunit n=1 Tax=Acrobeloides nanus TaxID=290746 RepID=A0A914C4P9_9BILA